MPEPQRPAGHFEAGRPTAFGEDRTEYSDQQGIECLSPRDEIPMSGRSEPVAIPRRAGEQSDGHISHATMMLADHRKEPNAKGVSPPIAPAPRPPIPSSQSGQPIGPPATQSHEHFSVGVIPFNPRISQFESHLESASLEMRGSSTSAVDHWAIATGLPLNGTDSNDSDGAIDVTMADMSVFRMFAAGPLEVVRSAVKARVADTPISPPDSSFEGSFSLGRNQTQGGLIELGPFADETSQTPSAKNPNNAESTKRSTEEQLDLLNRLWSEFGESDEEFGQTENLAADTRRQIPSSLPSPSALTETNEATVVASADLESAEGGMIELAPSANAAPTELAALDGSQNHLDSIEIKLDPAILFFQTLEVAGAPTEPMKATDASATDPTIFGETMEEPDAAPFQESSGTARHFGAGAIVWSLSMSGAASRTDKSHRAKRRAIRRDRFVR